MEGETDMEGLVASRAAGLDGSVIGKAEMNDDDYDPEVRKKAVYTASSDYGVVFPEKEGGGISTTATAKRVWAAAAGPGSKLAQKINEESNWRFQYPKHLVNLAEAASASPAAAVQMVCAAWHGHNADRGLSALHETFQFVKADGTRVPMSAVAATGDGALHLLGPSLHTATFVGRMSNKPGPDFPYRGKDINGSAMLDKLKEWAKCATFTHKEYGSCEPSMAMAIEAMNAYSEEDLLNLTDKFVIVLLGATSQMGPAITLMNMGFTCVAVARRGEKLLRLIKRVDHLAGELVVPMAIPDGDNARDEELLLNAGADLMKQPGELIDWLSKLYPDKILVLDSLAYLDGEAGLRVCVAMDAICAGVIRQRKAGKTALAYLLSPATAYPTSMAAYTARKKAYDSRTFMSTLLRFASNCREPVVGIGASGKMLQLPVLDGFITAQGPNYALSKTLQQWRAILERSRGVVVSANMAPPCRTDSVLHNSQAASAIEGMSFFEPNAAFDPDTASAILAWLLLYDLATPLGVSYPAYQLEHPYQLFWHGAFHGGGWRCPFAGESLGMVSYILGYYFGYKQKV